jgi:hypothetical protein
MTVTILVVSLGLMLGSWGASVCGWFLSFTRSYRKERNKLVIGLCYLVTGISVLGSLSVFLDALEIMDIRHSMPQNGAAMYAYTVGLISVIVMVMRSELKWRRLVGFGVLEKSSHRANS